jgi:hypothetical protein
MDDIAQRRGLDEEKAHGGGCYPRAFPCQNDRLRPAFSPSCRKNGHSVLVILGQGISQGFPSTFVRCDERS